MAKNFLDILREAFTHGSEDIAKREYEFQNTRDNKRAGELLDTPMKFLNNLRVATDDDMSELNTRGRSPLRSGDVSDTSKYISGTPLVYETWDGKQGKAILYTPSYDKNIVLGFDLENRSMTPQGGLDFLKGIVSDGGSVSVTNKKYNKQLDSFPQKQFTPNILIESLRTMRGK